MIMNIHHRGYSTQVKNKKPNFVPPSSYKKTHPFIEKLLYLADRADIASSDIHALSKAQGQREKRIYKDRANAINALVACFIKHLDLKTWQVKIPLLTAAQITGLMTVSEKGNISMSRASRAFSNMIDFGLIDCQKQAQHWDKEAKCWLPKYFEVTELFFVYLGVSVESAIKQQYGKFAYDKKKCRIKGKTQEEIDAMSITEYKREQHLAWRRDALEVRKKKQLEKKIKQASQEQLNKIAQDRVLDSIPRDFVLTKIEYIKLVEIEKKALMRIAERAPPN